MICPSVDPMSILILIALDYLDFKSTKSSKKTLATCHQKFKATRYYTEEAVQIVCAICQF